ncbi:1-aminocyclopropane-1-carboxylate synthase [Aureococcus anophagefferens]|nr:1-aminocyclopropane-1-carboxylate synthase [Aureococcus anophagefferens]
MDGLRGGPLVAGARTEGACVPKYLQKDALAEPLVVTVPPYATPAASPCGERAVGGYVAETWAPLGCVLPSEPGVRWLLVAGDSTLQELAVLFVAFLHAETTLACVRRALSDGDWVAVATCPLGGGATFDALLDLNFSAESLRCPRGHDRWRDFDATAPAVLFNSGLHDAARAPTRGARRFDRARTRTASARPGRSCEFAPNAALIWRGVAPVQAAECEGSGGNPGVKVMNAAAAPVARRPRPCSGPRPPCGPRAAAAAR